MDLPDDWKEFLSLLTSHRVRFLVIGAHALAVHGRPRMTGDLDILLEPTRANARRVLAALADFGFAAVDLSIEDFDRPDRVVALGNPPLRIDLLTSISGVSFDQAWRGRIQRVIAGRRVAILGRAEYLKNKRAAGRTKDLLDIELLEEATRAARAPPRKK